MAGIMAPVVLNRNPLQRGFGAISADEVTRWASGARGFGCFEPATRAAKNVLKDALEEARPQRSKADYWRLGGQPAATGLRSAAGLRNPVYFAAGSTDLAHAAWQ